MAHLLGQLNAVVLLNAESTTTVAGSAVDLMTAGEIEPFGASMFAVLTATARTYSGSLSIIVTIQEDSTSDFTNPQTVATFSTISTTAAVTQAKLINPTKQYQRAIATFDAATSSGAYAVSLIGTQRHAATHDVMYGDNPPAPPSGDLPTVSAATPILGLLGDDFNALVDSASIGDTWSDHSGLGNNYTRGAGATGLTKVTIEGSAMVRPNGSDDWMLGPSLMDNADHWAAFIVGVASGNFALTKIGNDQCSDPGSTGWEILQDGIVLMSDSANGISQLTTIDDRVKRIVSLEMISRSELHGYVNGVLNDNAPGGGDVFGTGCGNYSNSEPTRLWAEGTLGDCGRLGSMPIAALLVYRIDDAAAWQADPAHNRQAIEAWLNNHFPPAAPEFQDGEIGNAGFSTVEVNFYSYVTAAGDDYAAGATIKVNGSPATITGAARQPNHGLIWYTLSADVNIGDTVTWEYAKSSGHIVGEIGSIAMENVSAQPIANNVF